MLHQWSSFLGVGVWLIDRTFIKFQNVNRVIPLFVFRKVKQCAILNPGKALLMFAQKVSSVEMCFGKVCIENAAMLSLPSDNAQAINNPLEKWSLIDQLGKIHWLNTNTFFSNPSLEKEVDVNLLQCFLAILYSGFYGLRLILVYFNTSSSTRKFQPFDLFSRFISWLLVEGRSVSKMKILYTKVDRNWSFTF